MFTCIVCESDVSLCEIPIQLHGATCNHLIHTCIPCVHRFIRTAVTSHPRLTPSCPECPMPLSQKTIEYYMDEETKKTLEDRTTSEHLEADDTFVWCAGGCGNGQLHAGGSSQPIVTCKKCGKKTCFVHKCIWHGGVTCEEWEAVLKEDEQAKRRFRDRVDTQLLERINHARDERASETYLEKSPAKKCPKCGVWIEKIGGW
ncbi:hypothetical protein QBC38DRAFT_371010 [Podospora fimiseda]|uniref:RBR-type E3 ubiquitin transferase n=1 Tax=Podospora fimiseda TaxID=252190 RepID=A0AAN7BJH5_9PEZI|nr:hypothetical protein QBC38DRAFT_371010 [Podospora fimiseda]